MRSKLFKKIVAGVATLAMAMQLGFVIPASAAETALIVDGDNFKIVSDKDQTGVLVQATYNGTVLSKVSVTDVTLKEGDNVPNLALEDGVKLFLWKAVKGEGAMVPLCVPVTYEKAEPTPEPTPTPTPKPTIAPENIYYQLDFENEENPYIVAAEGTTTEIEKWASQYYFAGLSMAKDTNPEINRYALYNNNMTARKGQRTAYMILPEEAGKLEDNQAVVEFDFKFHSGTGTQQIVLIGNSDTPIGNDTYDPVKKPAGTAPILKLNQSGAEITINDSDSAKVTNFVPDAWAHATVVMNFQSKAVIVTLTSLDGSVTYFETSQVPMGNGTGATKLSQLFVGAPSVGAGAVSMDNIMVRKVLDGDVTDTYYTATFDVDGASTVMSAKEGDTLKSLPETDKTGYIFDGWYKDDDTTTPISSETVLATPLTANVKYTAVYHKNAEYIEPLVELQFSEFPEGGFPVAGADENTAASNPIQVKLIGEIGTDLLATPDSRVTDLDIKWEFDGFRTVVSKNEATTDIKDDEYCDSYAKVVKDATDPSKVDFQLKSQAFNFYGRVKATVTYNGKTMTIVKAMSILPNKTVASGVLLPKTGYVSDFTPFESTMVGYQATTSGDNKSATDIVTGDWAAYGGNSGRGLYLAEEEGKKFLKLNSTGTNSSSFAVNKLDAPTGQVIISQDIRFYNANSSILYKTDNPVTWSANATTISLNFTGSAINLNGGDTITEAAEGVWYHIVLSADVTSKLCYAKVYDMSGTLLGESDVMPFVNEGSVTPTYLCYRTPDNSMGTLDFNNVRVYTPEVDSASFKTTIANSTLSIPEAATDPASETTLTVSAKSTEGYDIVGAATWSVVGEPENITITPDASDSQKATLSVKNGAQPGEVTVRVSLAGATKDIPVTLSSSQDSVSFTKSTASISIPLTAGVVDEYEYAAAVVDKTGTAIAGKTVTLAAYDKNNVNELTTMPKGITFDKATGKLTVSSEASATTFYIRATGTNSSNEEISRAIKVTVHGLAFDFGTGEDEAVAEGYTAVTASTVYSDTTGYGISSGSPTAGGTASTEDADSDNLTGTFKFQAKVEKAKVYNVTVNYSGNIASEYVNSDLSGVELTNATKSAVTYTIPVIDDILDLSFSNATVSSIIIEKQADKTTALKPNIYTVGDSTIANNGSWAYVLNRDQAQYTDLTALASFSNNGRGGKNLSTYYTGGEFRDRVLSNVRPGDYVMIGDMGTNGMGSSFEDDFNYYMDACEALGAKVILNSYSPHGAVGDYASGYNAATFTFESYRKDAYDNIVRDIYAERSDSTGEKYDAKVVGFVDIGKMADAAFNAYVAEGADDTAKAARAQEIISCFGDHNHYSSGALAAKLMIEGYGTDPAAKGIVKSLVEIISADLAD